MPPPPRSILVVCIRLIGDVILSTPLIGLLKGAWPEAEIDMLVNRGTGEFLEKDPRIRRVLYSRNRETREPVGKPEPGYYFRIFRRYDMAINLNASDRGNIAVVLAGRKDRVGFHPGGNRIRDIWKKLVMTHPVFFPFAIHVARVSQLAAEAIGISVTRLEAKVFWDGEDEARVDGFLRREGVPGPYFVIHPFARWRYKYWLPDRFAKVSDGIAEGYGLRPVWTSSPDPEEMRLLRDAAALCRFPPALCAGELHPERYDLPAVEGGALRRPGHRRQPPGRHDRHPDGRPVRPHDRRAVVALERRRAGRPAVPPPPRNPAHRSDGSGPEGLGMRPVRQGRFRREGRREPLPYGDPDPGSPRRGARTDGDAAVPGRGVGAMNACPVPRRWLVLSYFSRIDGMACAQHIDDRIPLLREAGIEPVLLTGPCGERWEEGRHAIARCVAPSGIRFEVRHLFRKRGLRGHLHKILEFLLLFPVLPFYLLEKFLVDLDSQWSWFPLAARRGYTLCREVGPELIYSTGGAASAHIAAGMIARRTGIPWVAEFQDPLVHGDWYRGKAARKAFTLAERFVCARAFRVVFLTEEARRRAAMRTSLGDRGRCIYPGAELPPELPRRRRNGDRLRFAHLGSFGGSRNPAVLLAAVAAASGRTAGSCGNGVARLLRTLRRDLDAAAPGVPRPGRRNVPRPGSRAGRRWPPCVTRVSSSSSRTSTISGPRRSHPRCTSTS